MQELRVATLNIWNRQGPWEQRAPLIREELRALAPDVVGLQEVLRLTTEDQQLDQANELADGLDMPHFAYGVGQTLGGGVDFGNAILSKHPIVRSDVFALPAPASTRESRCLLYALVATPWGDLPMFVTHLNWKFHEGSTRLRQVQFIVERIMAIAPIASGNLPPVLVGDMNAEPDSDEMRYLRGLATVHGRSVFFADAWLWAGDDGPGHTFDRRNPYAGLFDEPPRRIDYIYVRGPDRALRGAPRNTRVVFASPGPDGAWPSDHFGVVTDLVVEPRPPR